MSYENNLAIAVIFLLSKQAHDIDKLVPYIIRTLEGIINKTYMTNQIYLWAVINKI